MLLFLLLIYQFLQKYDIYLLSVQRNIYQLLFRFPFLKFFFPSKFLNYKKKYLIEIKT